MPRSFSRLHPTLPKPLTGATGFDEITGHFAALKSAIARPAPQPLAAESRGA